MVKLKVINPKEFAKVANGHYSEVIRTLLSDDSILKATKFVSPTEIIRAVRKSYSFNNRKTRAVDNVEVTLTIGRPNYAEREFIAMCKKTNEPFPVKKIQLKFVK